jgi:hypothetical protein
MHVGTLAGTVQKLLTFFVKRMMAEKRLGRLGLLPNGNIVIIR